ncbi:MULTISPECIES: DUF982 domain-containing protein [unclassified Mesorhizobium]|uniref:DUF982 domain-containing protein n=1 Tax=unclassified Mesorhizobium TaxID=325217 RepID=UPI0016758AD7|nr:MULTISPECIES: DUF982 domain-containing protein [unclassified Mesorhizobium]
MKDTATGHALGVKSVETAIEQMRTWPKVGPKLKAAYPICYGVMEGKHTVDEARLAFEAAAKEAKVWRAE